MANTATPRTAANAATLAESGRTKSPNRPRVVHGLSLTDPRCADVLNALPGMAHPGRTLNPIQRQAAIENALSMALHFMRRPGGHPGEQAANLWAATARTNRALSLLKAASADVCTAGRA